MEDGTRLPLQATVEDFENAGVIVALKEAEHRPMIAKRFPRWQDKAEYWHIQRPGPGERGIGRGPCRGRGTDPARSASATDSQWNSSARPRQGRRADSAKAIVAKAPKSGRRQLDESRLGEVFGIDVAAGVPAVPERKSSKTKKKRGKARAVKAR